MSRRILALMVSFSVPVQAQDVLGVRFSLDTFPLCRTYGCHQLSRDAGVVRLQLRRQDARLSLVLSPYGTVMGLDAWVTGLRLAPAERQFLETLAERAAEQKLNLFRLRQCWNEVLPGQPRRVLGGGGEHYGVACLRRDAGRLKHWGVRVYFDH